MLKLDKDAFICDLAETYGVYDWRSLPLHTVATLAAGLREGSRILMTLNDQKVTNNDLMLASIADYTALLVWQNSKDGAKGRNRPQSMVSILLEEEKQSDIVGYSSGEEFERARRVRLARIAQEET